MFKKGTFSLFIWLCLFQNLVPIECLKSFSSKIFHSTFPDNCRFDELFLTKDTCLQNMLNPEDDLSSSKKDGHVPKVLMSIFIERPTPFMEEFFQKILSLNYPKHRLHVVMRNSVPYHTADVRNFTTHHKNRYAFFTEIKGANKIKEADARDVVLDLSTTLKCNYIFVVDSIAQLDNSDVLLELLRAGKKVLAPLLPRYGSWITNFKYLVDEPDPIESDPDYRVIVDRSARGVWPVAHVESCYLIETSIVKKYPRNQLTYSGQDSPDNSFCHSVRKLNLTIHVLAEVDYGHLINTESFDMTKTLPDFYQILYNKHDWEARYIDPGFFESLKPHNVPLQPCPNVYWFPMMTLRFCNDYLHILNTYGQWSNGTHQDDRIEGGYESVPTRDIHAWQVGFHESWLFFLREYIMPLQQKIYKGYVHIPRAPYMLVIKYKPDEQPNLKPHHDASTYTINIGLNTPGVDYEGGGCHFISLNCTVRDNPPGWMYLHPGRLTHYHEGLHITKGVRYIFVTFIDP